MRQPSPRGRRLCLTLRGGAFKGPAVGRTWGTPSPQSIPRGRGGNRGPPRSNPPSCLLGGSSVFKGKFPSVPGFGIIQIFFFFWWVGVRAIMASARRTSACFRLAAIWVGGGDIKARVGLRCKVKLPRRGSSAAARGRRRERAAGWRLLRCVHSLASLWRRGRREQSKDCRPGLGPARMSGYVCMCVRGRRCLLIRPCFFILHPSE